MSEILNVFDHQRFQVRTPDGVRLKKSFKEILTEPDAAYALDYAQTYYDVAALNLLAFLAQLAFEPATGEELAERIRAPMSEAEFEAGVSKLRPLCAITGDGPRFMQGPEPGDVKARKGIETAVFVTSSKPGKTQSDKRFLFRADSDWAVYPEQASLLMFARNTFYEGTGGRGFQKGTNGDTPIRALVTLPAERDTIWLRKSAWLNVLSRERQHDYSGGYAEVGEGYHGLFWVNPPERDIPVGGISLPSGLGWMTAFHWLWFEETDAPGICPLTGETVRGLVARELSKQTTGISYGSKGDLEKRVRADRLFRHPNVPTQKIFDKSGDPIGERPFFVHRTKGLVDSIGASMFGGLSDRMKTRYTLAPVVAQLCTDPVQNLGISPTLTVFGFHMLSGQKNVHGGIEAQAVRFPYLTHDPARALVFIELATHLMVHASNFANDSARALGQAIQRTAGAGVRADENEHGEIKLKKLEKTPSIDDPFGGDALSAFWRAQKNHVTEFAALIATAARDEPEGFLDSEHKFRNRCEETVVSEVWRQYDPIFNHYSVLPRTMPYAHIARRMLGGAVKKLRSTQSEPTSS